jgi:hypothetical protein
MILLVMSTMPSGPLSYFPLVLSVPLVVAALAGWWHALADELSWPGIPSPSRDNLLEGAGLALLLGAWVLLKIPGLHPSGTDDNIYFYMAHRVSQGAVPYRNFFFSHPPFHLLIPAGVFTVGGFSIGLAKAIPAMAQGLAGLFLYLSARGTSRGFALLVLLFHFTAYQVLMGSTDMNGENLMTAFLAAALFALVRGHPAVSGVLAAVSLGCGLYAFAGVVALGIASAAASRRALGRYALGFMAVTVAWVTVFGLMGGKAFFDGVFAYHLAKPVKDAGRVSVFESGNPFRMLSALVGNIPTYLGGDGFRKSLYYHLPHYLGLVVAFTLISSRALAAWWRASPGAARSRKSRDAARPQPSSWASILSPRELAAWTPDGFAKLAGLATVLFVLQWSAVQEVYDFYAVPMLALLAFAPAWASWRFFIGVRDAASWRHLIVPLAVLGVLVSHRPLALSLSRSLWPSEHQGPAGEVRYDWRDPWVLKGMARASRALFFAESRTRGEVTPHYRHYLWNKRLTFSTAPEIGEWIRDRTSPDETVTGASTLAPLVALYADRRMSGDEADTNAKRFTSGMLSDKDFFQTICTDNVRYVVAGARSRFTEAFMSGNPFLAQTFVREKVFQDPDLIHFRDFPISLYRRRDLPDIEPGRVCGQIQAGSDAR